MDLNPGSQALKSPCPQPLYYTLFILFDFTVLIAVGSIWKSCHTKGDGAVEIIKSQLLMQQ